MEKIMKSKRVTRFYCESCSKGFFKKQSALNHENTCWENPKNRTCKTCFHAEYDRESGYYECYCGKPASKHTGAPNNLDFISVNCETYRRLK